jgi:acetolactate synthase I/II/III large subunit
VRESASLVCVPVNVLSLSPVGGPLEPREAIEEGCAATRTVAAQLLSLCAELGVSYAFLVDGADITPLVAAVRGHPQLRPVPVPTEACALAMAEGFSRRSGRPALAVVCGGPGAASIAAMVAQAAGSGGVVIVLTGMAGVTPELCGWPVADVPLLAAAGAVAVPIRQAADLSTAGELIRRGLDAGRVLHVAIDLEVQRLEYGRWWVTAEPTTAGECSMPALGVPIPEAAERVVLAVGAAALDEAASIVALARRMNWPVMTDMTARGVIPEDDPLCLGHVSYMPAPRAREALGGAPERRATRIVALAMSPFLLEQLKAWGVSIDVVPGGGHAAWLAAAIERARSCGHAARETSVASAALPAPPPVESPVILDHGTVVETVAAALGPEAVHVSDAGVFHQSVSVRLRPRLPRTILATDCLTAMGWAFGAAMGAALAAPEVPVVAYVGDGSFHVQGLSLAVAARLGVRVLFVVAENGVYASTRRRHAVGADDPAALPALDLVAVAEACGVEAVRCDDSRRLRAAVDEFRAGSGPRVVVVPTGTTDPVASGRVTGLGFLDGTRP